MAGHCCLTSAERQLLANWRREGMSMREAAQRLRRCPSTISRELRRNSSEDGVYRAELADQSYRLRRRRSRVLNRDRKLALYVADRLLEGWSPEQVSGRLKLGLEDGVRPVGLQTIYRWIREHEGRIAHLRSLLSRKRRSRQPEGEPIGDKVPISARSARANSRLEAGHWEADLVFCKRFQPLLVAHERRTRLTLMTRLEGRSAHEVYRALTELLQGFPASMRRSITFDNDSCFAWHGLLRGLLSIETFFCDPYASWQKGGVENANGRIRRWLPRSADLRELGEDEIDEIAMRVNLTPRKCLGYKTPIEAFMEDIGKSIEIRFS